MGLNMRVSLFMRRLHRYHVAFLASPDSICITKPPFCRLLSTITKPHTDTLLDSSDASTGGNQAISVDRNNKNDRSLEDDEKESKATQTDHAAGKKSVSLQKKDTPSEYPRKSNPEVHMEEMIQVATEQLRAALQAWSVAEKAKAAAKFDMRKEPSPLQSPKLAAGNATNISRILPINVQPPPEGRSAETAKTVTDVSAKGLASGETQVLEAMLDSKQQSPSLPSDAWIRNKRSQFWEIVFSVPSPSVASNSVGGNSPFSSSTLTEVLSQTNRPLPAKDAAATGDLRQDERGALTSPILPDKRFSEVRGNSNNVDLGDAGAHLTIPPASPGRESGLQSSDTASQGPSEAAHGTHPTMSKLPYIRNKHKKDVALRLAELLNCDPRLGYTILERLSEDNLRLLLVMGTANEYYGKDSYNIVKQVKAADKDCDSAISAKEYEEWALNSWRHRRHHPSGDTMAVDQRTPSVQEDLESRSQPDISTKSGEVSLASVQKNAPQSDPGYIPWSLYLRLMFNFSLPFMAFGFIDNATLIIASDTVDRSLSETLGFTGLAAAGVGGIISGVAGIQVHGLAERWTRITPPMLTKSQSNSRSYERSTNIGNTFGIITGLVIGMLPLLFIRGDKDNEAEDNNRLRREEERIQMARRNLNEEAHA